MKKVKVKFVSFWPGFEPEEFFITKILRKYYDVEITEDADYVICSGSGFYEYLGSRQVRIMFSGENYIPDFNYIDYAFSVYPVVFFDRHFSFPGLVLSSYDSMLELSKKDRNYSADILKEKNLFANMIASHESERNLRGEFLRLAGKYKRVEAAGSLYNNMPNGEKVQMRDGTKFALQKKCKFTFCGESLAHEGFITEKIFDALLADTIPIYYGSSTISEIINKKAYIDIRDYNSLEDVIEKIIELDSDDEKYMEMLREPVFVDEKYIEKKIEELEQFVRHIFDQPLEQAYRRCRRYMPAVYEKTMLKHKKLYNRFDNRMGRMFLMWIGKIYWPIFEKAVEIKRIFIPSRVKEIQEYDV